MIVVGTLLTVPAQSALAVEDDVESPDAGKEVAATQVMEEHVVTVGKPGQQVSPTALKEAVQENSKRIPNGVEVAGVDPATVFEGEDDLLAMLMSGEGLTRMKAYQETHPTGSLLQRRKVVSAFLDKFALPERIAMEFEMPGWTADYAAALTRAYEEDVARIMAMPEVTFLAA